MQSFKFGDSLTEEQKIFFDKNGFLHFSNFISKENVALFIREIERIQKERLEKNLEKVNGVPLKFGQDLEGNKIIQRNCFLSLSSDVLHEFLQDPRLISLTELLYPYEGRIAENEKDGLILNYFERSPKWDGIQTVPEIFLWAVRLCQCSISDCTWIRVLLQMVACGLYPVPISKKFLIYYLERDILLIIHLIQMK